MEKNWTRASDMTRAPFQVGGQLPFHNRACVIGLVGMILAQQDDEWQDGRRYFRPETMAEPLRKHAFRMSFIRQSNSPSFQATQ